MERIVKLSVIVLLQAVLVLMPLSLVGCKRNTPQSAPQARATPIAEKSD